MWLRRRLGCAGSARLRILEGVRAGVAEIGAAPRHALGWSPRELADFASERRLGDVARAVAGRGDADALARIAWWGSALADLAPAHATLPREVKLEIGAAFNLAVALFDTAIDEAPIPRLALVEALAPQRLHARLHHPDDDSLRLRSEHAAAALVVGLFDHALSSTGRHLAAEPQRLAELLALLEAMYRSVLGQSQDPFVAKTGPVIFIGQIAAARQAAHAHALYAALAHFCQLWDDSLDVAEDFATLAPNYFLGKGRGIDALATLAYLGRGVLRIAAGSVVHRDIERALCAALHETIAAARAWNDETHAKTLHLCRELLS